MRLIANRLDAQYASQRMCREDLKDLALSIPETEQEFVKAKRAYFGA